ncbi:MAG: hypothetical protein M3219_04575 [Thermoproteota archaeon]|nr:hypothetical protein [Thermoproteota archaeon]
MTKLAADCRSLSALVQLLAYSNARTALSCLNLGLEVSSKGATKLGDIALL